jgi:protein N-terminal methyltransferase
MQDHIWNPNLFYDLIWLQWFLMYLSDEDLVKSLKQCAEQLTKNEETGESGLIIIKENVKDAGVFYD